MQQIDLSDYSIFVGAIFPALNTFLKEKNYPRTVLIVDENTQKYCLPILAKHIDVSDFLIINVPEGELNKNIDTAQIIWKTMMDNGVGRRDLCINLGGGVIGDMGGFAASTYKRGIDFIQIPTTLLSQVDASIGSLIENKAQWDRIKKIETLDNVDWVSFLAPSLKIKQRIVEIDPFEAGLRKALNFGHTIGHAIESDLLETPNRLLHGEAIAIGMICESYIAHKVSNLSATHLQEITEFFIKIYGKVELDSGILGLKMAL